MKLTFLNRTDELRRLRRLLSSSEPSLGVLYGRRRCGKSRLLQQQGKSGITYYLADQSAPALQMRALSVELSRVLPGFDSVVYPSWSSLFEAVYHRKPTFRRKPMTLVLDEFPYLVAESSDLPSIIQKMIDLSNLGIHLVLCGSSQRMMKGLVLNDSAPLYGRAREIIKVRPLKAGWICDALNIEGSRAIESYAVWGGVPRYWELAADYPDLTKAIRDLVLHRDGVLHNEPRRILLDDMRTDTQPHSVLAVIGAGASRVSEIGARLEKTVMNLTQPLDLLIELGLIRKDIPYGESEKNSKRSLYSIADPFLRFWYRFVYPNASILEQEMYSEVLEQWDKTRSQFLGAVWEDLARESVSYLTIAGRRWKPARRWWAGKSAPQPMEIDIVAESVDGDSILLGEAKWGDLDGEARCKKLEEVGAGLPFTRGKKIVTACWIGISDRLRRPRVITPERVLRALR